MLSNRPTFFANNWDKFGGRASAILSCYVLSKRLGCRFSFFWPEDERSPEMEEQLAFFSDEFLQTHQIFEDKTECGVTYVSVSEFTMVGFQSLIDDLADDSVVKIHDFFAVPKFNDETLQDALLQYSQIAKSVVGSKFKHLFDQVSEIYSQGSAIHGRFGDLLEGSFRQYVPITKYIDTITYRHVLKSLKTDKRKITFLSDSKEVTEGLQRIAGFEIDIDYKPFLNETRSGPFYKQCVDLFALASSRSVFAAPSSAFSQFATKLGGLQISDIRTELMNTSPETMLEIDLREHYSHFAGKIRGPLESRDLMNFLQIHWTGLEFNHIKTLIQRANGVDPEYILASCAWSITQLLSGNQRRSLKILQGAETEARKVLETHHDPLSVVLLTKFCLFSLMFPNKSETVLNELVSLSPNQFYFSPYLESWKARTSGLNREQMSRASSISQMFSGARIKNLLPSTNDLTKLWDTVMEANRNKSLYLLPWNEVLDTNQNEFLYSLMEMLLVRELGAEYQHHCTL